MGQLVDVIEHGGAGGGESRHGFEEGSGETGLVAADEKRHGADNAKHDPGKRNAQEAITAAHAVFGLAAKNEQRNADDGGQDGRNAEVGPLALAIAESKDETGDKHDCLKNHQGAEHLQNYLIVYHLKNFSRRFTVFSRQKATTVSPA